MWQAQLGLKLVQWTRFKWFQVLDPYWVISVSAFFLTDWIDPMSLLYQLMTTANNMNTYIPTTDLSWGSKTDFQCRNQITSSHFSEKLQDFTTLSLNYTKKLRGPWSRFSRIRLCATPWTAAYQASPSMGFSRQEHWSGLPFPSPMRESGKWKWSRLSRIRLCATPWTAAHQAPLSMGFSRQEYWSGVPLPSPVS